MPTRPTANPRSRAFSVTWARRGTSAGMKAVIASSESVANTRPPKPPSPVITALSVSSWRSRRPCPPPTAIRTANSGARRVQRASIRFATLTQAISRTNSTAPCSSSNVGCTASTCRACNGMTRAPTSVLVRGYSAANRVATASISACASASVTSGRSRPITCHQPVARLDSSYSAKVFGMKKSRSGPPRSMASSKLGASTPITAYGSPSSTSVRPMTSVSPPKRRCHRPCVNTMTLLPGRYSCDRNVRPRVAPAPRISKNPSETSDPENISGSPAPVKSSDHGSMAATRSKLRARSRQSRKFAGATSAARLPLSGSVCHSVTSRSGWGNGGGWRSTASTIEKMAVVAPIASVRVSTVAAVKPGCRISNRRPWRMSRNPSSREAPKRDARTCSLVWARPPRAASAWRRASAGGTPLAHRASISRSTWCCSSSCSSRFAPSRSNSARSRTRHA